MRGIKIPQYEFALKMQGGLIREGGRICGTLRYYTLERLGIQERGNEPTAELRLQSSNLWN